VLSGATSCELLAPVDDGSVRVVCRPDDLNQELNNGVRAFAFDSKGSLLAGWPVDLDGWRLAGRVIGDTLALHVVQSLGDVGMEGQPSDNSVDVMVAAAGTILGGAKVPIDCCFAWAVGPDGVAYGVLHHDADAPALTMSELLAVSVDGVPAGWPVSIEGLASGPSFDSDGRIVLTVASMDRSTSRVLILESDGEGVAAGSAELPIPTSVVVKGDGAYECGVPMPRPPLVARDGTTFVFSEIDPAIFALGPSLDVIRGWPFRPAAPLVDRYAPTEGDLTCGSLALPAVGPASTLYLPLQARNESVGGSLVAVGPDGRVRPGWPVELRRPGAEFWSVVVGPDGTVYALAIEPEAGDTSSASILAIAPDSTVRWTTTIIDP
jgi:hypothetical protein